MRIRNSRRAGASGGFTLIETAISLTVMVSALLAFGQAIVSSMRAAAASRESTLASEAARQLLQDLVAADFEDVYALFNEDPADDPDGVGTAPGANRAIEGLDPDPADADGMAGEVVFPVAGGVLREDVVDAALGMPSDLNDDGIIDGLDRSGDYQLLPVLVRVRWRGSAGISKVEFRTLLGVMP